MRRLMLAGGMLISVLAACEGKPEEKHYSIQAEVIAVELPKKLITVKHGNIPGLMPAMTMSYVIAVPKDAESLGPGDKISADLVVSNSKGGLRKSSSSKKPNRIQGLLPPRKARRKLLEVLLRGRAARATLCTEI